MKFTGYFDYTEIPQDDIFEKKIVDATFKQLALPSPANPTGKKSNA